MMDNDKITVPYIVHESVQVRLERTIKRLTFALILTIVLIFASNALWLWAWMKYDYMSEESVTTTTYTQDGRGLNIIGTGNEVTNGPDSYSYSKEEEAKTAKEE